MNPRARDLADFAAWQSKQSLRHQRAPFLREAIIALLCGIVLGLVTLWWVLS